jgi:predicted ABC-type ATPase
VNLDSTCSPLDRRPIVVALNIDPYVGAKLAASIRQELVRQHESFVFETVFADPIGDKLSFLRETAQTG